jgi:hypothetical protein
VTVQSRSTATPPLCKCFGHEQRHDMLEEGLRVELPLESHQNNHMEAFNTHMTVTINFAVLIHCLGL